MRKTDPTAGRVAAGKEAGGRGGDRLEARLGLTPVGGDDLADREAVLGVVDRRRQQLGPGLGAEPLAELVPAVDAARDRPAQAARASGICVRPFALKSSIVAAAGERPLAFRPYELLGLRIPDDGEQVAADPARHRLDHAEHRVGGDRGIDGVAPLLQDADRRRGRQRLAGRGHALPGHHGRPRLVQRPGRPVVSRGKPLRRPRPATTRPARMIVNKHDARSYRRFIE